MDFSKFSYEVIHRKIKYSRLEFTSGRLQVILPQGQSEIPLLKKYQKWIESKYNYINQCRGDAKNLTLLERTDSDFKYLIQKLVNRIPDELKVKINKFVFRKMKTKWASISSHNNITFNTIMSKLPEELMEYIVYHEVVHILERKHNNKFWDIIRKRYEEPSKYESQLLAYWFAINLY